MSVWIKKLPREPRLQLLISYVLGNLQWQDASVDESEGLNRQAKDKCNDVLEFFLLRDLIIEGKADYQLPQ